jgi:hypothetical protein
MCQPSKVSADWVSKGFHIHIGSLELVVRPTYTGGVVFKRWPPHASNSDETADAIRAAERTCLPDTDVRSKWIRDLERAIVFVRHLRYPASRSLDDLRNGRQYEFVRLIRALERFGRET